MASDARNQVQEGRIRTRRMRWDELFEALGVPLHLKQRPDVAEKMREIETESYTIWLNKDW